MLRDAKGLLDPVSSPKGSQLNNSAFHSPVKTRPSSPATRVQHRRQSSRDTMAKSTREPTRTTFAVDPPGGDGPYADEMLEVPDIRSLLTERDSPFLSHNNFGGGFASDGDKVALQSLKFESQNSAGATCVGVGLTSDDEARGLKEEEDDQICVPLPPWAVRAGARKKIFFNPNQVNAAVVTCGGLCPGLNDVVQGIVRKLEDYGVPEGNILGIRYGFRGFYDRANKPVVLTRKYVEGIQLVGGTILGTSRGGADIKEIVKRIDMWALDMVFVVGGNGGNAGANAIQQELNKHKIPCSVIGVPKSIDNDILLIDKCFGFDTAVEEAQRALMAAKVESMSAYRGIGLVKLMGRQSGFIAMQASMAAGTVDVCLIPEVKFAVDGPKGLLAYLDHLLAQKGHCTICMAEGAGQDVLASGEIQRDASGNPILQDAGVWLRNKIKNYFKDADVKYIDPSYLIRSIPTTSGDRIYCKILAHNAVHAAFAGYTGVTTGLVNTHYVLLPIPVVISTPRRVDPRGKTWNRLRSSIGMPNFENVPEAESTQLVEEDKNGASPKKAKEEKDTTKEKEEKETSKKEPAKAKEEKEPAKASA